MTPREYTWGTIGKGYILGTGPIACMGLHGLYGRWNDAASVGSDIQNGVLDLTKYTWFLPQLPSGDNDWGKNDVAANFKEIQDLYIDLYGDAAFQNASDVTYFNADDIHMNSTGATLYGQTYLAPAIALL